jgi:hypothetical protein
VIERRRDFPFADALLRMAREKLAELRWGEPIEVNNVAYQQRHVHCGHPFGDRLRVARPADQGLQVRQGVDLGGEGYRGEIVGVGKESIGQRT